MAFAAQARARRQFGERGRHVVEAQDISSGGLDRPAQPGFGFRTEDEQGRKEPTVRFKDVPDVPERQPQRRRSAMAARGVRSRVPG